MPGNGNGGDRISPRDRRTRVTGGYIDGLGNFYKQVGTRGGDAQEPIYRKQEGKYTFTSRRTGGDGDFVIRTPKKIEPPKPVTSSQTSINREQERARARAEAERQRAAAAERRRGVAERQRIDRERVQRAQQRDRPVTRGRTPQTRRPAPVQAAIREGASLLGAALVRDEQRGRQLVSTRRGRGTLLGIS